MAIINQMNFMRNGAYVSGGPLYIETMQGPNNALQLSKTGSSWSRTTETNLVAPLPNTYIKLFRWNSGIVSGKISLIAGGGNWHHLMTLEFSCVSDSSGGGYSFSLLNESKSIGDGSFDLTKFRIVRNTAASIYELHAFVNIIGSDKVFMCGMFDMSHSADLIINRQISVDDGSYTIKLTSGKINTYNTVHVIDPTTVNTNMNTLRANSTVFCNPASAASRPTDSDGFGVCITSGESTKNLTQIFISKTNPKLYYRSMDLAGAWQGWMSFNDSGFAPLTDPNFTKNVYIGGLGASLTSDLVASASGTDQQTLSIHTNNALNLFPKETLNFGYNIKFNPAINSVVKVTNSEYAMLLSAGIGITPQNNKPIIQISTSNKGESGFTQNGQVWTSLNQGAGSGLDADKVQGTPGDYIQAYRKTIQTGTDFNSLFGAGSYIVPTNAIATACTNCPSKTAGILEVKGEVHPNGNISSLWLYQIYTEYDTQKQYFRCRYNGNWLPWKSYSYDLDKELRYQTKVKIPAPGGGDAGPGYTYVRIRVGHGSPLFIRGHTMATLEITRDLADEAPAPDNYGGPFFKLQFYNTEYHSGSRYGIVYYGEHGGSLNHYITHCGVIDLLGDFSFIYLRMRQGLSYIFTVNRFDYDSIKISDIQFMNVGDFTYIPPANEFPAIGNGLNLIGWMSNMYCNGLQVGGNIVSAAAPSGGRDGDIWFQTV